MTTRQAPQRRVAPFHLSALLVLALGAWVHPAFSATGADARCDQQMDNPPMSASDDGKLAIRVLDHGTSTAAASDALSLERSVTVPALESSGRPGGAEVDVFLRRDVNEAKLQQSPLSGPDEADDVDAPLAVGKTEVIEEPAAALDTDQADASTRLPGFSADELLRYREQMFRKDI